MTPSNTKKSHSSTLPRQSIQDALEECPARIADLAWSAGFVDGEGCISAVRQTYKDPSRRACFRFRLQVAQNDLASLQRLQKILGVRSNIAQVKWNTAQNRPIYSLIVDGRHVIGALLMLEPFLFRKKFQARACFDLWEKGWMGVHPGPKGIPEHIWEVRESYFKRLQRMK